MNGDIRLDNFPHLTGSVAISNYPAPPKKDWKRAGQTKNQIGASARNFNRHLLLDEIEVCPVHLL
jgi:hypothetical protein